MSNITVLTDELGLQREYREVKRMAVVGERIKIVSAWGSYGKYADGDILTVDRTAVDGTGGTYVDSAKSESYERNPDGYISESEYVVLEPTDIVRIDSVRYRLVDRKANVGERVIVTSAPDNYDFFRKGDTGTVVETGAAYDRIDFGRHEEWYIGETASNTKYAVLELLSFVSTVPPVDDVTLIELTRKVNAQADAVDKLTELVANLGRRVNELERGQRQTYVGPDGKDGWVKVASGPVDFDRQPSFAKPPILTRDDVIERAKADIEALKVTHHPTLLRYYVARNLSWQPDCDAEFIVNRDKRTVVCLLRRLHHSGKGEIQSRGIARCAPDDVFNVHIGKAISLRRALGLEIPDEYVNSPKPDPNGDILAGTVVQSASSDRYTLTSDWKDGELARQFDFIRIIDDSREVS